MLGTGFAGQGKAARRIPVALQLFSVRQQLAADLPGTLAAVAKLGYEGVEFAGYHGRSAIELRRLLDQLRLPCCGAHLGIDDLRGDRFAATVEFQLSLGNRNLIVPGLPEQYRATPTAWRDTARLFADLAEQLAPHGLQIGYHNHASEFQVMNGERPWDIFFRQTPRTVLMQLDVGNAGYGGADPVAELKRYPGRAKTVHVKDYAAGRPDVLIGDGVVNWPALFRACEEVAGTEWYVVEQDSRPELGLADIAKSRERLREKGR